MIRPQFRFTFQAIRLRSTKMDLKLKKSQLIFVIFLLNCPRKSFGQENLFLHQIQRDDNERIENFTTPQCTFPIENVNVTIDIVSNKLKVRCNESFNGEIIDMIKDCDSRNIKSVEIIGCAISNTTTIRNITDKSGIQSIEYLNFECKSNNPLSMFQLSELNTLKELHYTGPLSNDMFNDLGNVIKLNLNTDIRFIDENIFRNLRKLTNLWIRPAPKISTIYNDTEITLPADIFQNQVRLTDLDLTRNNLTTLPEKIFANLLTLNHLDLSSNKLREIPINLFEPLSHLKRLDLNDNRIKCLHDDTFRSNDKLKQLHLEQNQLEFNGNSTIFEKTPNVLHIHLRNNSITTFPSKLYGELLSLDLSFNKIKELKLNIESLPSDKSDEFELIVIGNSLTRVPAVNISKTREILIDAANNSITEIAIDHLPENLKSLDVSYNLIKSLNLELLERSKTMMTFEMMGNPLKPWKCDCKFLKAVQSHLTEADFELIHCANGKMLSQQKKLCPKDENTEKSEKTDKLEKPNELETSVGPEVEKSHWLISMFIVMAVLLIALLSVFGFKYRKQTKNQTIDNQWRVYFLNRKDNFKRRCQRNDTTIKFKNMDYTHDIRDCTMLMNTSEASSYQ